MKGIGKQKSVVVDINGWTESNKKPGRFYKNLGFNQENNRVANLSVSTGKGAKKARTTIGIELFTDDIETGKDFADSLINEVKQGVSSDETVRGRILYVIRPNNDNNTETNTKKETETSTEVSDPEDL